MTNTNQLTPLTPNDSTSRLISWTQRVLLLDVLDQEAARLLQHAAALDAKLSEEADAFEIADDMRDYDQRCAAADLAHDRAAAVDDLLQVMERARFLTTRPVVDRDPITTIANALVVAHVEGQDVGEVLTLAVAEAQRTVFVATENWLTSNRPGSWEAALLNNIIDASGWDH